MSAVKPGRHAPNSLNLDYSHAIRRMLNRLDYRINHLMDCHKAKADCSLASLRNDPGNKIEWDQQTRPPVSRSEHIPGAQDRGCKPAFDEQFFARDPGFDEGFHDWTRMRHAHVNEMFTPGFSCGVNGLFRSNKINLFEFARFRRIRMCNSNKMNECVAALHGFPIGHPVKRIPRNEDGIPQSICRQRPSYQCKQMMPARNKRRDRARSDIPRGSGDEHRMMQHLTTTHAKCSSALFMHERIRVYRRRLRQR